MTLSRLIATEINSMHSDIVSSARRSITQAIRIGELLTEAKGLCEHGEWLGWLKLNVQFSAPTAQRYMRVFERRDELKSVTMADLTDAYRFLTAPKPKTETPPAQATTPKGRKPKALVGQSCCTQAATTSPQASGSGTTESRPSPATAAKVMESAGHSLRAPEPNAGCPGPEDESPSPGEERDHRESPDPLIPCPTCGELFGFKVCHCRDCGRHWKAGEGDQCPNCRLEAQLGDVPPVQDADPGEVGRQCVRLLRSIPVKHPLRRDALNHVMDWILAHKGESR